MKNQEKDLQNENSGNTEKKVDKRRVDSFVSKNGRNTVRDSESI